MKSATFSRLSYTHQHPTFRQQSPLYKKVEPLTCSFEMHRDIYHARQLQDKHKTEAERRREAKSKAARRNAFMVKRQKPIPVLKPSQALAYGPDRAAFNAQWRNEQKQAASWQEVQALKSHRSFLQREHEKLNQNEEDLKAIGTDPAARKALFKIERIVKDIKQRIQTKSLKSPKA